MGILSPAPIYIPIPDRGFSADMPFDATGKVLRLNIDNTPGDETITFAGGRVLVFSNTGVLLYSYLQPSSTIGKSYHGHVIKVGDRFGVQSYALIAHKVSLQYRPIIQLIALSTIGSSALGSVLAEIEMPSMLANEVRGVLLSSTTLHPGSYITAYVRAGENTSIAKIEIRQNDTQGFTIQYKSHYDMQPPFIPVGGFHGGNLLTLTKVWFPCLNRSKDILFAEYFLDTETMQPIGSFVESNGDPQLNYNFDPEYRATYNHADSATILPNNDIYLLTDDSKVVKGTLLVCENGLPTIKVDVLATSPATQGQQLAYGKIKGTANNVIVAGQKTYDANLTTIATGAGSEVLDLIAYPYGGVAEGVATGSLTSKEISLTTLLQTLPASGSYYSQGGTMGQITLNPFAPKFTMHATSAGSTSTCPIITNLAVPSGLPNWCAWYSPYYGGQARKVWPYAEYLSTGFEERIAIVHTPRQISFRRAGQTMVNLFNPAYASYVRSLNLDHYQQNQNFRSFDATHREKLLQNVLGSHAEQWPQNAKYVGEETGCPGVEETPHLAISGSTLPGGNVILNADNIASPAYLIIGPQGHKIASQKATLHINLEDPAKFFIEQLPVTAGLATKTIPLPANIANATLAAQVLFMCPNNGDIGATNAIAVDF